MIKRIKINKKVILIIIVVLLLLGYYMFYKKIYAKKITVRFPEEQDREVFLFIRSHSG